MKITKTNIEEFYSDKPEKELILRLIEEVEEINKMLFEITGKVKEIYIDIQNYHNKYSPERTDPCPDYFGYFSLMNGGARIGDPMLLNELDNTLYILNDLIAIYEL